MSGATLPTPIQEAPPLARHPGIRSPGGPAPVTACCLSVWPLQPWVLSRPNSPVLYLPAPAPLQIFQSRPQPDGSKNLGPQAATPVPLWTFQSAVPPPPADPGARRPRYSPLPGSRPAPRAPGRARAAAAPRAAAPGAVACPRGSGAPLWGPRTVEEARGARSCSSECAAASGSRAGPAGPRAPWAAPPSRAGQGCGTG